MKRILICGGGSVGLYTALTLQKRLSRSEAEITLVTPDSYMTYQSFLPEAASGNIEPRHVVVPLRKTLRRVRLISGHVTGLDHSSRRVEVRPVEGPELELGYDIVVVGLGSISRVLPVPGLAEHAVGFKSVEEAIYLRNHVLARLEAAESSTDPRMRKRALTFVFVGAGYSGVEALAELEDLATDACKSYPSIDRDQMRWVLVEASGRILPEVDPDLGSYAIDRLRARGIEVRLETRLESADDRVMVLSDGESFEADTLVWTTGVRANPVVGRFGFPIDERGRLRTDEFLRVEGVEDAWAAGDCAAVPDLVTGGFCPPTAQYALREAKRLGKNVAATIKGEPMEPFRYKSKGLLVSLGRYKGVAKVLGVKVRAFPAWFLHRTYHVGMIPTFNRKVRIVVDWTVALFFKRDVVQLGSLRDPRGPFEEATRDLPS